MDKKSVLVAYASRYGSTQEVAETIASVLGEAGLLANLKPVQQVQELDGYDAVVLGAALYNARWNPDAHQFLAKYQSVLKQRPIAIFTLGPLNSSSAAMQNSQRQLNKELAKYSWLKPFALEVFAGKYDPSKPGMSLFYKILPTRDYRNWQAIHAWATRLPAQMGLAEIPQYA